MVRERLYELNMEWNVMGVSCWIAAGRREATQHANVKDGSG